MAKRKEMGRPQIKIKWDRVEKMAMGGSNGVQIAAAIGIHYDTLASRFVDEKSDDDCSTFSEYLRTKREKGNDLLLRKQYDVAIGGDKAMLIWLGKQRLSQSEKINTKNLNADAKDLTDIKFEDLSKERQEAIRVAYGLTDEFDES